MGPEVICLGWDFNWIGRVEREAVREDGVPVGGKKGARQRKMLQGVKNSCVDWRPAPG